MLDSCEVRHSAPHITIVIKPRARAARRRDEDVTYSVV